MKEIGSFAVDTNAVIDFRAGVSSIVSLIRSAETVFVPAVVVGELLYGAMNSRRIQENEKAVFQFLKFSSFIPVDEKISAKYAFVRVGLKKVGRPLPENDIWIAATCIEVGVPLLSRDAHFNHIDNLELITWD